MPDKDKYPGFSLGGESESDKRARWENRAGPLGCFYCKAVWTEERRKKEKFWGVVCDTCGRIVCEKCSKRHRSVGIRCQCGGLLLGVPEPLPVREPGPPSPPNLFNVSSPPSLLIASLRGFVRFFLLMAFVMAFVLLSGWIFEIAANAGEKTLGPLPRGTKIVGGVSAETPVCVVCGRPATRILASQAKALQTTGGADFEMGHLYDGLYCDLHAP